MTRPSELLNDSLLAMPLGCAIALIWANTLPESYFRSAHALAFAVNDIALAFFLAVVVKEVVEATLPGGALHPWRRAALPVVASLGGVGVPLLAYFGFLRAAGELMLAQGWVVICAVDISASYILGHLIFGRKSDMSFVLLLAISMNTIGMIVLAIAHPARDATLWLGAVLMFAAIATAVIMRRRPVKRFWPYVLGPGVLSWWALYVSGVHPALALVPIIPFLPHASRDAGLFVDARPQAHDALTSFERWWRLPVQGVLLMFGLVNAGVPLTGHEAGMWALPLTVIIGRPIGVMLASGIGVACGLRLPSHVGWRDVAVAGCITSVGFVMALFFATVAMPIGPLLAQLKIGALLSIIGAVVAIVTARILGVGRYGVARRAS